MLFRLERVRFCVLKLDVKLVSKLITGSTAPRDVDSWLWSSSSA